MRAYPWKTFSDFGWTFTRRDTEKSYKTFCWFFFKNKEFHYFPKENKHFLPRVISKLMTNPHMTYNRFSFRKFPRILLLRKFRQTLLVRTLINIKLQETEFRNKWFIINNVLNEMRLVFKELITESLFGPLKYGEFGCSWS